MSKGLNEVIHTGIWGRLFQVEGQTVQRPWGGSMSEVFEKAVCEEASVAGAEWMGKRTGRMMHRGL